MKKGSIKPVRCAIYTRVSTVHGLEQDFNSLDAQHDATQAYIRSQAHAGWTLIRSRYADGGYSGGSTERPALQRLLADVRARKVDVVVLRESIAADFQKIAEDPVIAKRLGDTGQIMSVLGPAQFGARVQEQRDKLAALAKTLGVKAAQ